MKCIYCGSDMQLGGIVTQGVSAMWFSQESLKKSRLSKIIFEGGIAIGKKDYLWGTDDTNRCLLLSKMQKIKVCMEVIPMQDKSESLKTKSAKHF